MTTFPPAPTATPSAAALEAAITDAIATLTDAIGSPAPPAIGSGTTPSLADALGAFTAPGATITTTQLEDLFTALATITITGASASGGLSLNPGGGLPTGLSVPPPASTPPPPTPSAPGNETVFSKALP